MPNTLLLTINIKWPTILTTIICANAFQLFAKLSLNQTLKFLELFKCLVLSLQSIDPKLPRTIINKCEKIKCTTFIPQKKKIRIYETWYMSYLVTKKKHETPLAKLVKWVIYVARDVGFESSLKPFWDFKIYIMFFHKISKILWLQSCIQTGFNPFGSL